MTEKISNKYLLLHFYFFLYSCAGLCAKFAAAAPVFSLGFIGPYGLSLLILLVCALLWQIILRGYPLTAAFAHKGTTVVWGMLWGWLIFGENLNAAKLVAALLVIAGVACLGQSHE
ncbi:MAG: transporter [Gracilibacteraceae bacterium]|jgi:drug/metabolite transporter (DMT)-like permease|nr:transporter [Gracilibacteraceae bacterium]